MKKKTKRTIFSLLLLGMVSMIPAGAAFADEYVSPENFVITGEFTDSFTLKTNEAEIFSMPGCAPGDYATGKIEVTNDTYETMEFCILEIQNKQEDESALFDLLELSIRKDGELLYKGVYGEAGNPVTDYFKVKPEETITFDVYVSFPKDAGNAYQGTTLDSIWVFDAKHPGYYYGGGEEIPEPEVKPDEPIVEPEPDEPIIVPGEVVEPEPEEPKPGIKTGVELIDNNTMPVMMLFAAILAAVIAFILIKKAKNNAN